MKERLAGIGLAVGTALTLGMIWADSAQAFSIGSSVTVTNSLKTVSSQGEVVEIPFQASLPTKVKLEETELQQFGGIWDIDLGNNSISFTLNSKFRNVVSGDDVYRFLASDFSQMGQTPIIKIFSFASFSSNDNERPFARFRSVNELEVVFPLKFSPDGLLPPTVGGTPGLITELPVEPYAIPTPSLLPGLVGMGLAALRKQRKDHNSA